ncbi:hypothetical protein MMC12_003680 [Toensbergia leucococca]|nr:hypothetical protein [Toensbergia leucococca]
MSLSLSSFSLLTARSFPISRSLLSLTRAFLTQDPASHPSRLASAQRPHQPVTRTLSLCTWRQ